jgi:YHS domain-containing protein
VTDPPKNPHPLTVKKPAVNPAATANQFPNPFPNGSEQSADQGLKKENPFSGLKITNDPPKVQKPAVKKSGTPGIQIRSSGTPKVVREIPRPTTNSKPVTATKPRKAVVAKNKKNPHADKLRRIAERKNQKGLKGFCPVVLRDQRDLADIDPELESTYDGKRYFFSSVKAKATFENSPQKYAPVKGGQDIIALAVGSKTVDGSLDHAVWFKDRLYLFANQETLRRFVREPKKYAVVIKK